MRNKGTEKNSRLVEAKVLNFLKKIPRNKVVTYSFLGKKFGIHPRKIAQILARNEHPEKYPCYKVIYSNGKLGGYSLGIKEKIKRLKRDGIEIINGKVRKDFIIG